MIWSLGLSLDRKFIYIILLVKELTAKRAKMTSGSYFQPQNKKQPQALLHSPNDFTN